MTSKPQMPKDLGVKIASKEESMWLGMKEAIERENMQSQASLDINGVLLPFVEEQIKKHKI